MGAWEWIYSATDFFKQKTPDVTPVTEACRKGYEVGWEATTKVNGAVRSKAGELHEYFSDDQVRADFARIATDVSKNSALYLARAYGAGPVIDVVTRSLQNSKEDPGKERIKELEIRVAKLEKELSSQKTPEQAPMPTVSVTSKNEHEADSIPNLKQSPEDVLKIFRSKKFIDVNLLDDLIVPGTRSSKKEKPVPRVDGLSKSKSKL